jgi:hypothetical protein
MSSKLSRVIFLSVVVFILAAAVPAFAGQEPAPAPGLQAAPAGCPPSADLFATQDQAVCKANSAVAVPEQPEFMTAPISTNKYHGYCQCGCRFVKDCNTDADCHGGRCLSGVSCC